VDVGIVEVWCKKLSTQIIQTTIRLPEDLHQQVKIQAIKNRVSLNDLLVEAVVKALPSQAKKAEE
jgi:predicted HicB family RNase H-like nuclease